MELWFGVLSMCSGDAWSQSTEVVRESMAGGAWQVRLDAVIIVFVVVIASR